MPGARCCGAGPAGPGVTGPGEAPGIPPARGRSGLASARLAYWGGSLSRWRLLVSTRLVGCGLSLAC